MTNLMVDVGELEGTVNWARLFAARWCLRDDSRSADELD